MKPNLAILTLLAILILLFTLLAAYFKTQRTEPTKPTYTIEELPPETIDPLPDYSNLTCGEKC